MNPLAAVPPGMDFCAVVNVTGLGTEPGGKGDVTGLADAILQAQEHGMVCYLEDDGVQVAAIVPVRAGLPS